MSPETTPKDLKICPTCGTKVNADAARCVVCGTNLSVATSTAPEAAVRGSQMPKITLGLPAAIGMILLLLAIGALIVYFAMSRQSASAAVDPTTTPTITLTPTVTASPTPQTPTPTNTPEPSPTPLSYTVKLGDTCGGIAFAFDISIQSIVLLNNLAADCNPLSEGQKLSIPQPTPTPTAQPTATLSGIEATIAACDKLEYTVQDKDTLGSIALNYQVSGEAIKQFNGLPNDIVVFGQQLIIPLCQRNATPGPTPTATPPPPYPAANLLLPAHGAPFSAADEIITLQWASVGTLRENEAYAVTIEDITAGQGKKLVDYVIDTKYIIPASYRPLDNSPHIITWWVVPVRQIDTDDEGNPVWDVAGAVSDVRAFVWSGISPATPAP